MSLFGIALRNIKRNFNNYFLYFVSMVFSIMIYYTFKSIQYNKEVLELSAQSLKVSTAFKVSSIIIAVFAAMFIWYSNSFFTRKRKKEIALYCMLGVKKRQAARMLFYENLLMGILALFCGILMGSLFSKLFVMILVKLMAFEVTVSISISFAAILNTAQIFLILFTIASLHGYSLIYRFKLINLFKSEKVGQRQPKASLFVAVLSVIFIGAGYYMALNFNYTNLLKLPIILVITVIGTYMFFSSLIVFLVKHSRNNKRWFYKGMNMIGTSHLLFRIKGHGRSLATIAVLSATTITAMGTAACLYYDQVNGISANAPFSYAYVSKDSGLDKKIEQIISKYDKNQATQIIDSEFLKVDSKWPNIIKLGIVSKAGEFITGSDNIMSESNFRKLLQARGIKDDFSFESKESIVFLNMFSEKLLDNPKGKMTYYYKDGVEYPLSIKDFRAYRLVNSVEPTDSSTTDKIIIKDEVYNKLYSSDRAVKIRLINIRDAVHSKELTKEIETALKDSNLYGGTPFLSSYYSIYTDIMSTFGLVIFLAFFVGLVFLICTGSIIFFKQLSEANEEKERYEILKKVGVTQSEIKASIAKQMLFIFALPLLLGIIHSFAAISILEPILTSSLIPPLSVTILLYTVIYLIYYFVTVNSYSNIVTK